MSFNFKDFRNSNCEIKSECDSTSSGTSSGTSCLEVCGDIITARKPWSEESEICVPSDDGCDMDDELLENCNSRGMKAKAASRDLPKGFTKYLASKVTAKKYSMKELKVSSRTLAAFNAPNIAVVHEPRRQEGVWLVYGSETCPYCKKAIQLLTDNGQEMFFLNMNLIDKENKDWIIKMKPTDITETPVVFKDHKYFGVYSDLKMHFQ